ncbi:hypothetical protein [Sphaerisporangium sp. TRM90804]|nr:hypothetical protein [Sphaerisporangium sp. TRM90804]MDH2424512.1 hypothetical protein [Sphaerisporangium sp. TRM90804]
MEQVDRARPVHLFVSPDAARHGVPREPAAGVSLCVPVNDHVETQ